MPRLLAVEGDDAGLALPVCGDRLFLATTDDGRIRLSQESQVQSRGVVLYRVGENFRARNLDEDDETITLNGQHLGDIPIEHGDLLAVGGATLIFDRDETFQDHPTTTPSDDQPRAVRVEDGSAILYRQPVFEESADIAQTAGHDSDRLVALLTIATALTGTLELSTLLLSLLDQLFDVIPADRGTVLVFDREVRQLKSIVGKRRGQPATLGGELPVSRAIVREALLTRNAVLTLDARSDKRFAQGESVKSGLIRSAMCLPVVHHGRVLAVIHLITGESERRFGRRDLEMAATVASIAGFAIDNANLYRQAAEHERLRYTLELASQIQAQLLPDAPPRSQGIDVAGSMQPANELGGDHYDFIAHANGSLHVVVGDVSGKGVVAGLVMAIARSYFRPYMLMDCPLDETLQAVNHLLYHDTGQDVFMSAVYLRWDPAEHMLSYCGAGQEHILWYHKTIGELEVIPAGGVALALVEDLRGYIEGGSLALEPGDLVILYSDGITEARNGEGEFFSLQRLKQLVLEVAAETNPDALVADVHRAVTSFVGASPVHDDRTVVVLQRTDD